MYSITNSHICQYRWHPIYMLLSTPMWYLLTILLIFSIIYWKYWLYPNGIDWKHIKRRDEIRVPWKYENTTRTEKYLAWQYPTVLIGDPIIQLMWNIQTHTVHHYGIGHETESGEGAGINASNDFFLVGALFYLPDAFRRNHSNKFSSSVQASQVMGRLQWRDRYLFTR